MSNLKVDVKFSKEQVAEIAEQAMGSIEALVKDVFRFSAESSGLEVTDGVLDSWYCAYIAYRMRKNNE